jgi:hypothetical protein
MDRPNLGIDIEQATQAIIARYAPIPEVDSIYLEDRTSNIQVYILQSNPVYDEALMDRLLDLELEIHKEIDFIYFQYIPLLGRKREECISQYFQQIYHT